MIFIYIFVGIIALLLGIQVLAVISAKKSRGMKLSGLQGELKALEKQGSRGLVYFHSPSCHACKQMTPMVRQMKHDFKNVFDVDVSKDRRALQAFGIRATPTTMLVESGVVTQVLLGAKPKEALEKLIR